MIPEQRVLWQYTFARQSWFGPWPVRDGTPSLAHASPPAGAGVSTLLAWPTLATPRAGQHAWAFGADLYHRLHFFPPRLALGNVVGVQERTIEIWNAHLSGRRLNALALVSLGGVVVTSGAVPADLAPLQQLAWTIQVTPNGPPVINGSLDWHLDGGQVISISVTGNRVTAWVWLADWSQPVVERYEWLTDVLTSHDGTERRRSLRAAPRASHEFAFAAHGDARRSLELMFHGWGARVWARPQWQQLAHLSAPAAIGALSLSADITGGGFAANSLAMLHDGDSSGELVEVQSVTATTLTLLRPTGRAWPAGSRLYPAQPSRLAEAAQMRHETDDLSVGRVRFDDELPAALATTHGLPTYRGAPVLPTPINWAESPDIEMDRKLARLDNATARPLIEDESGRPAPRQSRHYTFATRVEAETWRRVLAALRGRHGALWVDTGTDDLRVVAAVAPIAVTLDVRWCGYTLFAQAQAGRRDVRIVTTAGVFLRRVLHSEERPGGIERLTIDAALGVELLPEQFRRVSFLMLCRLDADAAEIAWQTDTVAQARVAWRSVPDEL